MKCSSIASYLKMEKGNCHTYPCQGNLGGKSYSLSSIIIFILIIILIDQDKNIFILLNSDTNYSFPFFFSQFLNLLKQFIILLIVDISSIRQIKIADKLMLTISDLNQIIKYYAFNVQQRIEELEHFNCYSNYDQQSQEQYEFITVISKYNNYATKEEREVKFAKKLKERVIQIFQHFKNKSNNPNLLTIIQEIIDLQMTNLISNPPIKLGDFFSYIHLISKRGCIIRPPAQKKRIVSKSILKQAYKLQQKITPSLSLFNIKKRTVSIVGSNKHLKVNATIQKQKWKLDDMLNGPWNVLDLQKMHLTRIKEGNQANILKDAFRRNQKILSVVKKNEKRKNRRVFTTQDCDINEEMQILSQMKTNTIKEGLAYKKKRPICAERKKHYSIKQNISFV